MKNKNLLMITEKSVLYITLILLYLGLNGCKKYLEAKPDQSIATPSSLSDLEGLLDNYAFINGRYPSASEVSTNDFYLTSADWGSLNSRQQNFYLWQKTDDIGGDYTSSYTSIEYANIMLTTLSQITSSDVTTENLIEGSALFTRASYHFALAQLFAKAYDKTTAGTDPGIALRLTSDITVKPVRSTVSQTYTSVIADLKQSAQLLPTDPAIKYHPSKPAAFGLLARVYLSMSDYVNAGLYADSCLQFYDKLIDYNTISKTSSIPFVQFNDEVIYDARSSPPAALSPSRAKIDSNLYASYDSNDLRKVIYFKSNSNGAKAFKGNYTGQGNASVFTGIATDEVYLTAAECAARNNNIASALQYLNKLLSLRWTTGTFINYSISDPQQLLAIILQERRKELLFRSLRWIDLRRLNKDPNFAQTISRSINGAVYTLPPNGDRYVFEIDQNAVNLSGLVQNP